MSDKSHARVRFGRRIVAPCHDSSGVVSAGERSVLRYAKHAQVAIENALPNASIAIATSATGLLPLAWPNASPVPRERERSEP